MDKLARAVAPGKLILIGEHAVVYGHPAISLPFTHAHVACTATLHRSSATIETSLYSGPLRDTPGVLEGLKALVPATLQRIGRPPDVHASIKLESTIPHQRGLGSSAAASVATVRALYEAAGESLADVQLLELVAIAEGIHHQNPSGVDAATIVSGRGVYYQKGEHAKYITPPTGITIVVADTGTPSNTRQAVQTVRALHDTSVRTRQAIQELGELTRLAKIQLTEDQPEQLGHTLTQGHELLQTLNISSPKLDTLVRSAIAAGAYGAKLTGGGQGGCMLAVCSPSNTSIITQALKAAGAAQTWSMEL